MRRAAAALSIAVMLAHAATGQDPIARLSGVALDPHSQPVIAGRVTVEVDGVVLSQAFTDATGRFVVKDVPREGAVVRVTTREPSVGATFVDDNVQRSRMVQVHTMPARRLTGRVEADGKPVPGAWVAASPLGVELLGALAVATRAEADGSFELPCVPCRELAVRVWTASRYGLETAIEASPARSAELVCALPYPAKVEHTVEIVGGDADALADARLTVVASYAGSRLLLPPEFAQPGAIAPGKWLLRSWPLADRLELTVESDLVPAEKATRTIPPFHSDRHWTFDARTDGSDRELGSPPDDEPPPPIPIRATILSSTGDPIAGASVIAGEPQRLTPGFPAARRYRRLYYYLKRRRRHGTTDLEGELVIQPFYPGEAEHVLQVACATGWAEVPFRRHGDEVIELGEIRCERGTTLRGTVRDPDGQPRPAALLIVLTFEPSIREGRFAITGLPPGRCEITRLAGSTHPKPFTVTLKESVPVDVTVDR